jgi:hypothetical protein
MDPGITAIFGAIVGGFVGMAGGVVLEMYKRHRERQGIASALAGEISTILFMTKERKYIETYHKIAELLECGQEVSIPTVVTRTEKGFDPVMAKNLDRLGSLGGSLPEGIVKFYTIVEGLRFDVTRLAGGEFKQRQHEAAELIRRDIKIWADIATLGSQLVGDLQSQAKKRWLQFW